uniref:Uncharacterized protein n=1 Tax=Salix viminalis TaxID=40686 RepID=A0A6N2MRK5_SALVM
MYRLLEEDNISKCRWLFDYILN